MKTNPSSDPERAWHDLVQRARADAPPAVDLAALLRRLPNVTPAAAAARPAWGVEFNLFLGQRAWAAGALAACGMLASAWMWADAVKHDLPWIELATSAASVDAEEAS
jgi:hypothetical protein